jgi:hypothetical protein
MTREEFEARFRLLEQVTDGPVRTFHAQARSRAVVMVHFLEGTPAERALQLARIEALEPAARSRVIEVTEVERTPVVVTRFIFDLTSLPEWLAAHSRGVVEPSPPVSLQDPEPAPPPQPATPSPAPEAQAGGEFTRLFHVPPRDSPAAPPPAASPPVPPAGSPEPVRSPDEAGAEREPGEFTRLFGIGTAGGPPGLDGPPPASGSARGRSENSRADGAPVQRESPASGAAPPGAAAAPGPPSTAPAGGPQAPAPPDGFTALFRVGGGDAQPSSPPDTPPSAGRPAGSAAAGPPAPSTGGPGDPAEVPRREPPAATGPPAAHRAEPLPQPGEPGEFTRIFGSLRAPPPSPQPAPEIGYPPSAHTRDIGGRSEPDESEYRETYLDRLQAAPPPSTPAPPASPPPLADGRPAPAPYLPPTGPSEFTRVISSTPPEPRLPPAPQGPLPAPPVRSAPPRWLRRVFAILIAIALTLITAALIWSFWPRAEQGPAQEQVSLDLPQAPLASSAGSRSSALRQ